MVPESCCCRKAKPDVEMTPEEQQRRQKQRDLRVNPFLVANAKWSYPWHLVLMTRLASGLWHFSLKMGKSCQDLEEWLQNMAIKMRSEGMPYKRPPQKKRKLEVKTSIHSNGRGFQDHIETGSRPTEAVQV